MDEGTQRTVGRILLGFTWELPQSMLALVAKAVLKARPLDCNGHFRFVFKSSKLSSFSLGEFIFFNEVHTYLESWDLVQKHEHGHSIQSRILGPLYLLLIGLPSFAWNVISQHSDFFSRHYYDTPWEVLNPSLFEREIQLKMKKHRLEHLNHVLQSFDETPIQIG